MSTLFFVNNECQLCKSNPSHLKTDLSKVSHLKDHHKLTILSVRQIQKLKASKFF